MTFLPRNKIGYEGAKAIGEALKVNSSLTQIDFELTTMIK